jgi:putative endonuclease
MAAHNEVGKLGESLAVKHLEANGFIVFDRNYNFEKSEVDIVAYIPEELHFIEVKTRSNTRWEKPEAAVTQEKQAHMVKAANFYLYERQMVTVPCVFDVIAISLDDPENPEIVHFEDVFRPSSNR